MGGTAGDIGCNTHMFTILIVVSVLDLVEVILVQLPDERCEIGVFEHPRQDRFCEFVHVLDDKTVASRTPRNDILEIWIFEHPERNWLGQFVFSNPGGNVKRKHTCKASSRNRRLRTWNPPSNRVSTRTGSCSAPEVLYGRTNGTPA